MKCIGGRVPSIDSAEFALCTASHHRSRGALELINQPTVAGLANSVSIGVLLGSIRRDIFGRLFSSEINFNAIRIRIRNWTHNGRACKEIRAQSDKLSAQFDSEILGVKLTPKMA